MVIVLFLKTWVLGLGQMQMQMQVQEAPPPSSLLLSKTSTYFQNFFLCKSTRLVVGFMRSTFQAFLPRRFLLGQRPFVRLSFLGRNNLQGMIRMNGNGCLLLSFSHLSLEGEACMVEAVKP